MHFQLANQWIQERLCIFFQELSYFTKEKVAIYMWIVFNNFIIL